MIVIYPGSFDPFTLGHEDIIKRALSSFDKLKIAVSEDNAKTSVFSLTERLEMAEIIAKKYQNVRKCKNYAHKFVHAVKMR